MLITFPREPLLALLITHRDSYSEQLAEAQAGYRLQIAAAARTEAGKLLAWAARADADQLKPDEENHFSVYVDQPEDRTTHYDRAVAMLQASDAEYVELNETDYARYVLDEWEWRSA